MLSRVTRALVFMFLVDVCTGCSGTWEFPSTLPSVTTSAQGSTIVTYMSVDYGKYFTDYCQRKYNNMRIFHEGIPNDYLKTVIHFHPGGFISGQRTKNPADEEVLAFVKSDFTYISVGYRLVNKKYYWKNSPNQQLEEEYIKVSDGTDDKEKGEMTLVNAAMSDRYQIKVGRQEFVTKCLWDAKTAMDRILEKTDWFMVDTTRVGFLASSAGGAEAHYCMWIYPRLNPGFIPTSAALHNAQFDYTVQNMLDKVWGNVGDAVGKNKKLKHYLSKADCGQIVGNPWCSEESTDEVDICNEEWDTTTREQFCEDDFNQIRIKDLIGNQTWPTQPNNRQQRGLAYLWYPSEAMQDYDNTGFVFYVKNTLGGVDDTKGWAHLAHHSTFVTTYMNSCNSKGIQCIGYFPAYHGMKPWHQGNQVTSKLRVRTINLGENWQSVINTDAPYGSIEEKVDVHIYAMSP